MGDGGVSQLVFFVASLAVAGVVSGALLTSVEGVSSRLSWRGGALSEGLATDIEVINDPTNVATNPTVLYVKNTGSTTPDAGTLTVLLDGVYKTFTATLLNGAAAWKPSEVVQLDISGTLSAGDHSARIIAPGGNAEDFRFTI